MTLLETRFAELLGLDVALVQAPIGSATCPALAASVADAGALGTLAVTWREPEAAREVLAATRERTDGVLAANVVVDPDAKSTPTAAHVDAALEADVDVLSFSFGLPAVDLVDRVHDAGGVVLQSVGDAATAERAVDRGADVVVAQGNEAGGHVEGDVATLPLVPRVVDAVDVPVVAAGGVADGRGVAAALALGADGAWLGTRFLATEEANVHRAYRERVVDAAATETTYGTPYDGGWPDAPHRVLDNETTDAWTAAGRPSEDKPGAGDVVAERPGDGEIRRYEDDLATPGVEGDVEELPLYAGQSAGLTDGVASAGDVVAALVEAAETTADRLR